MALRQLRKGMDVVTVCTAPNGLNLNLPSQPEGQHPPRGANIHLDMPAGVRQRGTPPADSTKNPATDFRCGNIPYQLP